MFRESWFMSSSASIGSGCIGSGGHSQSLIARSFRSIISPLSPISVPTFPEYFDPIIYVHIRHHPRRFHLYTISPFFPSSSSLKGLADDRLVVSKVISQQLFFKRQVGSALTEQMPLEKRGIAIAIEVQ